jgi:protein-tyrosine phosphatase
VSVADIAADHALSTERLPPLFAMLGRNDQGPVIAEMLARENITSHELIIDLLAAFDAEAYLRLGGLDDAELSAVRARLLDGDALTAGTHGMGDS